LHAIGVLDMSGHAAETDKCVDVAHMGRCYHERIAVQRLFMTGGQAERA
jgi:hypothetical protein